MAIALPSTTRIQIERKLRGWDEYQQIRGSEFVVVSYGKSGRTWLRTMISVFFRRRFHLTGNDLLRVDNFQRLNSQIPAIFFTHDEYVNHFVNRTSRRDLLLKKKVLFLVRDPRDVTVSMYFHCQNRMKDSNKLVNQFSSFRKGMPIFDFIQDEVMGLPAAIAFTEKIMDDAEKLPNSQIVRYEDLRAATAANLKTVISFLGYAPTDSEITECIEQSSIDRMREAERLDQSSRFRNRDADSLKARRGVVGGFVDYLTAEQREIADALLRDSRLGRLGYGAR